MKVHTFDVVRSRSFGEGGRPRSPGLLPPASSKKEGLCVTAVPTCSSEPLYLCTTGQALAFVRINNCYFVCMYVCML